MSGIASQGAHGTNFERPSGGSRAAGREDEPVDGKPRSPQSALARRCEREDEPLRPRSIERTISLCYRERRRNAWRMLPFERTTREELSASPRTVEGLVISPSRDSARPLVDFLRSEGVNVQVVNTPELGFEEALLHRPGIVIIEEGISKAGGVDLCARLKANARTHFLPVVVHFRGAPNDLFRLDALAAGADAIFSSETSKAERRARLWALLRSQAMFRR